MKPDILHGLSPRERQNREEMDTEFVGKYLGSRLSLPPLISVSPPYVVEMSDHDISSLLRFLICIRYDLDHPQVNQSVISGNCADCGCDIQVPATIPQPFPFPKVCVCCAARRIHDIKVP
jgi:hypothetical protein